MENNTIKINKWMRFLVLFKLFMSSIFSAETAMDKKEKDNYVKLAVDRLMKYPPEIRKDILERVNYPRKYQ